ncbi:MAG: hypothetical protein LBE61_09025 [Burkholderiaceae bacterium]|nr:hypothetical protein [Burkholderiaceae bacterium]
MPRFMPIRTTLAALGWAICTLPAHAALDPSDKAVLENIYNSTGGPGWSDRTNWMAGDPCANAWYGVTCDASATHVTQIKLNGNNLSGPLPRLSALASLTHFEANNNSLTGTIPSLTGLTQLSEFYAESNQLTGSIPDLAGLSALRIFDVNRNQLTGPIPSLAGLGALEVFYANFNRLGGFLPNLSGLGELKQLRVRSNLLTGPIPDLSGTPKLTALDVSDNSLTGVPPAAPPLLTYAAMCPNFLHGPSPTDAAWNAAADGTWSFECAAGWLVTVTAGPHGSSSKASHAVVEEAAARLTLTADPGYVVDQVNGTCPGITFTAETGAVSTEPIMADCTINATFKSTTVTPPVPHAAPVPTLGFWAMMLMGLLVAGLGLRPSRHLTSHSHKGDRR